MMFEEVLNRLDTDNSETLNLTISRDEQLPMASEEPIAIRSLTKEVQNAKQPYFIATTSSIETQVIAPDQKGDIEATMKVSVLPRKPRVKIIKNTSRSSKRKPPGPVAKGDCDGTVDAYVANMIKSLISQTLPTVIAEVSRITSKDPITEMSHPTSGGIDAKLFEEDSGISMNIISTVTERAFVKSTEIYNGIADSIESPSQKNIYHMHITNEPETDARSPLDPNLVDPTLGNDSHDMTIPITKVVWPQFDDRDVAQSPSFDAFQTMQNKILETRGRKLSIDAAMQTEPFDLSSFLTDREKKLILLLSDKNQLLSNFKTLESIIPSNQVGIESSSDLTLVKESDSTILLENQNSSVPLQKSAENLPNPSAFSHNLDILSQMLYKVDDLLLQPWPRRLSKDTGDAGHLSNLRDVSIVKDYGSKDTNLVIRLPEAEPPTYKKGDLGESIKSPTTTHLDIHEYRKALTDNALSGNFKYAEVTIGSSFTSRPDLNVSWAGDQRKGGAAYDNQSQDRRSRVPPYRDNGGPNNKIWMESLQEIYPSRHETKLTSVSGPRLFGDLYEEREQGRERLYDPLTGREMSASFMAEAKWAGAVRKNSLDGSTTKCMSTSFSCTRSIRDPAVQEDPRSFDWDRTNWNRKPKPQQQNQQAQQRQYQHPSSFPKSYESTHRGMGDSFSKQYLYMGGTNTDPDPNPNHVKGKQIFHQKYSDQNGSASHTLNDTDTLRYQNHSAQPRYDVTKLNKNDVFPTIKMTTSFQGLDTRSQSNHGFQGNKPITAPSRHRLSDIYLKATTKSGEPETYRDIPVKNSPIPWNPLFKNCRKLSTNVGNIVSKPFYNSEAPKTNGHISQANHDVTTNGVLDTTFGKGFNSIKRGSLIGKNLQDGSQGIVDAKLRPPSQNVVNDPHCLPGIAGTPLKNQKIVQNGTSEISNDMKRSYDWSPDYRNGFDARNDPLSRSLINPTSPVRSIKELLSPEMNSSVYENNHSTQNGKRNRLSVDKSREEGKEYNHQEAVTNSPRRPSLLNLGPTVKEQIDISHKIANSLSSPDNQNKASRMFLKRAEKAKNWENVTYGSEMDYTRPDAFDFEPENSYYEDSHYNVLSPTGIPKYASDPRQLVESPLETTHPNPNICTHDKVSPDVCRSIVKDLLKGCAPRANNSGTTSIDRGAEIFAKRRQKSNDWIVDSGISSKEECMNLPSKQLENGSFKTYSNPKNYSRTSDLSYAPPTQNYDNIEDSMTNNNQKSTYKSCNAGAGGHLWASNSTNDGMKMSYKNFNTLPRSWKPVKEKSTPGNGHLKDEFDRSETRHAANQKSLNDRDINPNKWNNDESHMTRDNRSRYDPVRYANGTFF